MEEWSAGHLKNMVVTVHLFESACLDISYVQRDFASGKKSVWKCKSITYRLTDVKVREDLTSCWAEVCSMA